MQQQTDHKYLSVIKKKQLCIQCIEGYCSQPLVVPIEWNDMQICMVGVVRNFFN